MVPDQAEPPIVVLQHVKTRQIEIDHDQVRMPRRQRHHHVGHVAIGRQRRFGLGAQVQFGAELFERQRIDARRQDPLAPGAGAQQLGVQPVRGAKIGFAADQGLKLAHGGGALALSQGIHDPIERQLGVGALRRQQRHV